MLVIMGAAAIGQQSKSLCSFQSKKPNILEVLKYMRSINLRSPISFRYNGHLKVRTKKRNERKWTSSTILEGISRRRSGYNCIEKN